MATPTSASDAQGSLATESADAVLDLLKAGPVLLYDGECGVCAQSVQWILRHETRHSLRFAALESDLGRALTRAASVPTHVDSLLWVERSELSVKAKVWSGAVLATVAYVGGPFRALGAFWVVPRPLRDWAYRLFAKHRKNIVPTNCLVPTPATRLRFLDSTLPG